MITNEGMIEIKRDWFDYAERLRANLMDGMQPLDEPATDQILRQYYVAKANLEAGKAVLV